VIVVDTSAIFAILYDEADADRCTAALLSSGLLLVSAGTLVEARVLAVRAGALANLEEFLARIDFKVVPVDAAFAAAVGPAYTQWGKGFHTAKLNLGDMFAYVLAKQRACPLLYVGGDFALTDITSALQ
jgi:ribonuclease VapC